MVSFGLFSTTSDNTTLANVGDATLKRVVTQAQSMFPSFNDEFSLQNLLANCKHNNNHNKNGAFHDTSAPDRDSSMPGFLSPVGKQQISRGLRKCNPLEITSFRDPMLAPVANYEIGLFVWISILMSSLLNKKFGLDLKEDRDDLKSRALLIKKLETHWRFNLRFLADVRTVVVLMTLFFLIFK